MLITELPSCPLIEEPSRKSLTPVSNLLIFKGNKILIAQIQKNIPPIQETIPNHNRKALPENISKLVIIKPVVVNESIEIGHTLKSTLSADHRVLDGAVAGKLLKDFNDIIEDPFQIWMQSNDMEII